MLRVALKGILASRARLVLTAFSVILGIAFVSGSFILSDTISKTFDEVFENAFAGTDVVVSSEDDGANGQPEPIPATLLPAVEAVDGVGAAAGGASLLGVVPIKADGEPLTTTGAPQFGFSWTEDEQLNPFDITEGAPPETEGQVAIDAATFTEAGYAVGDRITVVADAARQFELVGVVEFGGGEENLAGATAVLFTLPEMQRLAGLEGQFDSINLAADDGVSAGELSQRVAAVLPPGVQAQTGQDAQQEQANEITDQIRPVTYGLLGFAFVSVLVSAFIIFNTFSITVSQRARQMALLRAVGASGRQVRRSVLIEALVLGLVASAIGLFAGLLVASGLKALFGLFGADIPSTTTQFLPRTWIVAMVLGTGITLIASYLPARRASRVPPVAAMRDEVVAPAGSPRARAIGGGIAAIAAIGLIALSFALDGAGPILAALGVGALLLLLGVGAMAAALIAPMARAIGAPLRGVSGRLGRENAMRNPRRSAITAAALMIGLALVSASTVATQSLSASFSTILDEQFPADYIVTTGDQEAPFSPEAAAAIARQPRVGAVGQLREGDWRDAGGAQRSLNGVNADEFGQLHDPEFTQGGWNDLVAGTVMVSEGQAGSQGVGLGDELVMTFARAGEQRLRVAAIFDESIFGDYFVSLDEYERNYAVQQDIVVFADAAPGAGADAAQAEIARAIRPFPNLEVQNQREFKDEIQSQSNQVLGLIFVLLAFAILIAIFGIVNTLALSVFERTREIGLLRAIGMAPRQTRRMVMWESVIVALIGGILGLVVGTFLGVMLVERAGSPLETLSIPIPILVALLVLAALAGVLAGVFPAWRASRINVLRAIAQE